MKISAHSNGKVGLVALRYQNVFPLPAIDDVLAIAPPEDDQVELLIDSPGPTGFIVYVMSNGELA